MRWIREDGYEKVMKTEVEPYVSQRKECGFDARVKGQPIYYEHFRLDHPKGVIVISHGFTESIQKFTESIYYMMQAGYEVWDWITAATGTPTVRITTLLSFMRIIFGTMYWI